MVSKAKLKEIEQEAIRLTTDFDNILKSTILLRTSLENKLNEVKKFEERLRIIVKQEEDNK